MHRKLLHVLGVMITWRYHRRPRKPPATTVRNYWPLIAGALLSAGVVAVTAFSASYQHQYELYIRYGQSHWVAGMLPLTVEGLIASTTLALWCAAQLRKQAREMWPAYLVLAAAIGQTALMNLAADDRFSWAWIGPEISVWPAVAFVAAYEMSVWIYRNRPERQVTVNEGVDQEQEPSAAEKLQVKVLEDLAELLPPTPAEPPVMTGLLQHLNGSAPEPAELIHTCNGGAGPKGGRKTPGCPRCDALLAGTVAPKGNRKGSLWAG